MKNSKKGAISIVTAISIAGIILLEAVLAQGAWLFTAKGNLEYKLSLAGQSVLAGFDSILYEDYGLIAAKEREDASEVAEFYFNGENNKDFFDLPGRGFKDGDYLTVVPFKGEAKDFLVTYDKKLGNLDVFQEQITGFMQYKTPEKAAEFVMKQAGLIDESENSDKVKDKYEEACEAIRGLSVKANELYHSVCGYSSHDIACVNGFDDLKARDKYVSTIQTKLMFMDSKKVSEIKEGERREDYKAIEDSYALLIADYKTFLELNNKALQKYRETANEHTKTEAAVKEFKNWIKTSDEAKKSNSDFMDKLKVKVEESEEMLKKTTYANVKVAVEKNIKMLKAQISKLEKMYAKIKDDEYVVNTKEIKDSLKGYEMKELYYELSVYNGDGHANNNLLSEDPTADADNAEKGCTVDVDSEKEIKKDLFDRLPSNSSDETLSDYDIMDKILTDDYAVTYFSNATDESYDRFRIINGEVEYILHGDRRDKKNISNTLLKIFGIRSGFNFLYIISDSEKVKLARAIGAAMAAATTCAIAEPIFTAVVLSGWALCEAGMDVSALKKGEEVPLIKTKETWRLSISGIGNVIKDNINNEEREEGEFAMNYEGYLRVLLFSMDQEDKLLRIQDLIEANISTATESNFSLGDYSTSVITSCNFYTPLNAIVDKYYGNERKGFEISGEVQVTY